MKQAKGQRVAGVDGCKGGWVAVLQQTGDAGYEAIFVERFELLLARAQAVVIAVDVPIGLLDAAQRGGRECEHAARAELGGKRQSSVFTAPTRAALTAWRSIAKPDYQKVSAANRASSPAGLGISQQVFHIMNKIDEVDRALVANSELRTRVHEVHPELCFATANGGPAMPHSKKGGGGRGRSERIELLEKIGFIDPLGLRDKYALPKKNVKMDDLLDACIACWTARRLVDGLAKVWPAAPPTDAMGLRMEVVA